MKAEYIKSILKKKLCPVHDVHPVVDITGDELTVACCCTYFEHYCAIEIEYMRSKRRHLSSYLKGVRILDRLAGHRFRFYR